MPPSEPTSSTGAAIEARSGDDLVLSLEGTSTITDGTYTPGKFLTAADLATTGDSAPVAELEQAEEIEEDAAVESPAEEDPRKKGE